MPAVMDGITDLDDGDDDVFIPANSADGNQWQQHLRNYGQQNVYPRSSTPVGQDAMSPRSPIPPGNSTSPTSPTSPDWQEYKRTLQHKKQVLLQVRLELFPVHNATLSNACEANRGFS